MTTDVTPPTPARCREAATARVEAIVGTASPAKAVVALEDPGPWGFTAWKEADLEPGVAANVRADSAAAGVRAVLIRRSGHSTRENRVAFAAHFGPEEPWTQRMAGASADDIDAIDMVGLASGVSVGWEAETRETYLVCTHGKHDPCCAQWGRPVYAALAQIAPEQTWECSHLGGERFAANMLCLPYGIYYGGLTPETVRDVVAAHGRGDLWLPGLRGRCAFPAAAQAAEIAWRNDSGEVSLAAPTLLAHGPGEVSRTEFAFGGSKIAVELRAHEGKPVKLTCGSKVLSAPVRYETVSVSAE